jgi:hypothetical protein
MSRQQRAGPADRLLVVEVALVLLLFALAVGLYIIPAEQPAAFLPDWWAGIVLAILFFSIVVLHALRRRRGPGAAAHVVLDEPVDDPATDSRD